MAATRKGVGFEVCATMRLARLARQHGGQPIHEKLGVPGMVLVNDGILPVPHASRNAMENGPQRWSPDARISVGIPGAKQQGRKFSTSTCARHLSVYREKGTQPLVAGPTRMEYVSNERRVTSVNGVVTKKTRRVRMGPKGNYKEVVVTNQGKTKRSRKPLTRKEINCIKQCKFYPGLFDTCEQCL